MKLVILAGGSGQHAAVVYEAAFLSGMHVAGFLAIEEGPPPQVLNCPYLGTLERLADRGFVREHGFVAACGDNRLRQSVSEEVLSRSGTLLTVVHPSAIISPSSRVGAGSVILAGAIVGPSALLEQSVIVNHAASVDHDCIVEAYANLCPGARLGGKVRLGAASFVGINASILPGRTVGARAIVGAGAVVTRDVAANVTVAGMPARALSSHCG